MNKLIISAQSWKTKKTSFIRPSTSRLDIGFSPIANKPRTLQHPGNPVLPCSENEKGPTIWAVVHPRSGAVDGTGARLAPGTTCLQVIEKGGGQGRLEMPTRSFQSCTLYQPSGVSTNRSVFTVAGIMPIMLLVNSLPEMIFIVYSQI